MKKLLNHSLKRFMTYAAIVLVASIPVYYWAISQFWQYELDEHHIVLTPEAGREDTLLIIGAVTLLTVLFFVLLLGGFVLINRSISKQLWQPFYSSLERIRQFDLHQQQSIQFEPTDIAEFAALNESLDKLLAGNMAAYHRQKEFADNASHELQTPLAIAQSKMELLLQGDGLTREQYEQIESALKALARVTRINKNLLLLTKIENSQYQDQEAIYFTGLVNDSIQLFFPFMDDKELRLTVAVEPEIEVVGNKILVELVVHNLLNNAIRHSEPSSVIKVILTADKLEVRNAGRGALAKEQLFKRFAASGSWSPGTGLGLALVKQICDRYGWVVTYAFADGQHIFTVQF